MTKASQHSLATMTVILAFMAATGVSTLGEEMATRSTRTRAEVEVLIKKVGGSSPEWWDSVEPGYPATLDLNWPLKAPGKWNARKNVDQYI